MSVRYNVTGAERKKLAMAVGEILSQPVVYAGAPTFGYKVGSYSVDRHGTLLFPADVKISEIKHLLAALKARGYVSEDSDFDETDESGNGGIDKLTIEIPFDGSDQKSIENLANIIRSKKRLIKKILGVDDIQIINDTDKLCFPWFSLTSTDGEVDAYGKFVSALCEMAKKQKRVTAKEHTAENEKFEMRIFLIRLGFVGDEYKAARKILLRNLTGNSAFKDGKAP
jgi:hypothetical protein